MTRRGLCGIHAEAVCLLHRAKSRTPGRALRGSAARQQLGGLPPGIGFHRAATRQELTENGVVHPGASEEPRPNITALRGIRGQRPRPHMGGCALGPLARTRLRFNRGARLSGRCRWGEVHSARLHIHNDKADL